MKKGEPGKLAVILILGMGIFMLHLYSGAANAATKKQYKKEDCVKCHAARVNDIATAGKKHRSVPCVGCHPGHPPEVKKPIAQCAKCHPKTRKAHFEEERCLNCHKNPHTPLNISLTGKEGCLNCHATQIRQLKESKSKHTALDCSFCHDVHRKVPKCTQCHMSHSDTILGDCKECHNAHMPRHVRYTAEIPSKDCGACHSTAFSLLAATETKHKPFACAFCHQEKHKMVPKCRDCHGSPHPAGIMAKFSSCGECHKIAHDLNNWTATDVQETANHAPGK